uniref:RNA-directed DNA polymerase, eukaryota n=1 Tax=Tanacetum cinerariifolium TaxID=118510 RepID=A0A699K1H7_TANCI|nr:RNA-directed DNA polymerase, eukaryota [Tanacetum cinerariifolium]
MVFKVDFAKAYDSIRWDFLDDVLDAFGFGSKWRLWIRGSLYSDIASVILNGSHWLEFEFHRGFKQGDPLAPYLFILIMKSFHLSISRAVDAGIFWGFNISDDLNISHIFYADDAVFIREWNESNLSGITQILRCFSLLSGLNINLSKSHLLGVGVSFESVSNAASIIGCSTMRTPFKYLGVMVGDHTSKVHAWDDTISKVKSRLSNWKSKTLSVGGLDYWYTLRDLFPRIYALETFKGCSVASKLLNPITLSLRREVRCGVESDQLALLEEIIGITILSNMEDRWTWDLNSDRVFRATRWVKFIPIKINVFAWKLYLDRLPTRSNLLLRGVHISDVSCSICASGHETSSHIFFSCCLISDVVRFVCRWWNVTWSPLGSYSEWLAWFNSIRLNSFAKGLLESVFYVSWWSVWMFRNQLLFSAQNLRKDVIFDDIVSRSFTFCHSKCRRTFNWDSWLQHPYLISL